MAVIDLDDTLLSPDKQISESNLEALDTLRNNSFEIIIASGRHHDNIIRFEDRIGRQGWVISSNGAVVRHAQTFAMLQELTLTPRHVLEICRFGAERGLTIIAYHRDGVFAEKDSEWTHHYARNAGWQPRRGDLSVLAMTGLQKLLLSHSAKRIDTIQPEAEQKFGSEMYVVRTDNEILELAAPGTNKALGAQAVARMLGIDSQNVVAFGDGNNDVELLSWAGLSVAMNHGRESARQAAKFVSPPGSPGTAFARAVQAILPQETNVRGMRSKLTSRVDAIAKEHAPIARLGSPQDSRTF
jgi:Cof subfamily protein (haloacid dehalogenase superfamily)